MFANDLQASQSLGRGLTTLHAPAGLTDLQVVYRPAPSPDHEPFFFLWSLPVPGKSDVSAALAHWGVLLPPKRLRRSALNLALPSEWPVAELGARARNGAARVTGYRVDLLDGLRALSRLDDAHTHHTPSASLSAWSLACKLVLELVGREHFVPTLQTLGDERTVEACWVTALTAPHDRARFEVLAHAMPPVAHCLPETANTQLILRQALDALTDRLVRAALAEAPAKDTSTDDDDPAEGNGREEQSGDNPSPQARRARRPGPWEERFTHALVDGPSCFIPWGLGESRVVEEVQRWARPALGAGFTDFCAEFILTPPKSASRKLANPWLLGFGLRVASEPALTVDAAGVWEAGRTLVLGSHQVDRPQDILLRDLAEAARIFPPIGDSLEEAQPVTIELSPREAWLFLLEAAPIIEQAGMGVVLPDELAGQSGLRVKPRLRLIEGGAAPASPKKRVRTQRSKMATEPAPPAGDGSPAGAPSPLAGFLGPDALARFRWEAAIGDETLSAAEFDKLLEEKQPLVEWRGEWVLLDPDVVGDLKRWMDKSKELELAGHGALAAVLSGDYTTKSGTRVEVVASDAVDAVIDTLRSQGFEDVPEPTDFCGSLRTYQKQGLRWLVGMAKLGLGACLADDMGLGKTIQLIALLLHWRTIHPQDTQPSLVICPTSVLGNWQREIERFAPDLPVRRHHGPERHRRAQDLTGELDAHAVVLTTYALARRDAAMLGDVPWSYVVLDEAQYVKNAASQQARAVRSLRAARRVALTGTPVENRLAELWSIYEFLNPGLLGPLETFRRELAIPVERYRDGEAEAKLKKMVGPFLLRRVKSDPRVIQDLPEKLEMTVHCSLTREQAALYQAALDRLLRSIEESEGMSRRGLILKLITALKQICNHPVHFERKPGELARRSGKLDRLLDMLAEARDGGDKALVYTQYREMGKLLVAAIEARLGERVLFLHGGVPVADRERMVDDFQNEGDDTPIFVLSLKAGGTGLNLTAANHVFHFDRWWNPAVEDQATDRAYRIGQTRTVQVHKMVTLGTLEERIDRMLIEKRELAERIVGTGEAWLTELNDTELRELFELSTDAVVGGEDQNS